MQAPGRVPHVQSSDGNPKLCAEVLMCFGPRQDTTLQRPQPLLGSGQGQKPPHQPQKWRWLVLDFNVAMGITHWCHITLFYIAPGPTHRQTSKHTYTQSYIRTSTFTHTHLHTHIHMQTHTHNCTHIHTHTHASARLHTHTHMQTCALTHGHTCMRARIHTCIHAYMSTCAQTPYTYLLDPSFLVGY